MTERVSQAGESRHSQMAKNMIKSNEACCISCFALLLLLLLLSPSCLSQRGLPTSLCLHLSLSLPTSFCLILFISHRDGPQRHSAELSDLNKCLRLELGLSCGLGCRRRSRCSSRTVVIRHFNESLSKPSSLFVTLSLWHVLLMGWEMR